VRVPPNLCKILYEWGLQEELATATRCRKSAFHSSESSLSCALFSRLCACVPIFATVPRSFAFCIFFYPSAGTISNPCLLMFPALKARHHFSCLIPLFFSAFWDDLSFWIYSYVTLLTMVLQSRPVRSWVISSGKKTLSEKQEANFF